MAPILLALAGPDLPSEALERALALARARGGPLHVLRVLSPRQATLPPRSPFALPLPAVELLERLVEQTRAWLEGGVDPGEEPPPVEVLTGDFQALVTARGRRLGVALVVVPAATPQVGALATRLADRLGVPVLVARRHRRTDLILAASDLRDEAYPVLHAAAALAGSLGAPLVAVHNVIPPPRLRVPDPLGPLAAKVFAALAVRRREQLQAVLDRLQVPAEALVWKGASDDDAILGAARTRRADLVVVGTRHHSWLGRLLHGHLAAHVVERALRSVLVLPLRPAP